MSEKHFIGDWVTRFEDAKAKKPISRVTFMYDDENGFTAGDDTGLEIVASCYFATQAMADNALAALKGYQYHPFSAGAANLDPAAELGDGVTVGGIYSVIAGLNDDGYGFPDVEAPGEAELEEQFPHPGFLTQEVKRKVALGRSYYGTRITRANGLEVVKAEADGTEKSRAKFNSDVLAFYDDDGVEALYFDAVAKRYRFRGDVEITGGSMNINGKFIVDTQGNLTLNGNINLSGGSITWGGNLPPSGISSDQAGLIARTEITETLIKSPKICTVDADPDNYPSGSIVGLGIYGSSYYDSDGVGRLQLDYGGYPLLSFAGLTDGAYKDGFSVGIMTDHDNSVYIGVGNGTAWTADLDDNYMSNFAVIHAQGRHTFDHEAVFAGTVDFSGATVTGLDIVFG